MSRYTPGERASNVFDKEACLMRAHSLACAAINLLMDARKELSVHGKMQELGLEAYRVAKDVEWLSDEIEHHRRLLSNKEGCAK